MSKNKAGFSRMGVIIVVAAVVVVAALAVFFTLQVGKEEPIEIGAVLSLSGPGQYSGVEVRDGMLLAVDEINTWGGINGRKLELIIEDHKTDPEESKKAFDRIETAHQPVLYLSSQSSVALALGPLVEEHQVVLVCLLATAPEITEHKEWVFRYWPTAEAEVPPILSILEDLKVKKLGILYQDNEVSRSLSELLQKKFKGTGGIVEAEDFKSDMTDLEESITRLIDMEAIYFTGYIGLLENIFKTLLKKLHFDDPSIYILCNCREVDTISSSRVWQIDLFSVESFEQLKEEDFRGPILGGNMATFPTVVTMPEAQGVYVAAPIIYDPDFPFAKEIEEKYVTRYDKPFNHAAASGYDSIRILAGLWEDEEISRDKVESLLEEGFVYSGVFGGFSAKPGEHDITFPLHPAQIVDGEIQYLR